MSRQERQAWQAMLDADPKLRAAWDGFTEQLARDAALIEEGALTTGQALGRAAKAVHAVAGRLPEDD